MEKHSLYFKKETYCMLKILYNMKKRESVSRIKYQVLIIRTPDICSLVNKNLHGQTSRHFYCAGLSFSIVWDTKGQIN